MDPLGPLWLMIFFSLRILVTGRALALHLGRCVRLLFRNMTKSWSQSKNKNYQNLENQSQVIQNWAYIYIYRYTYIFKKISGHVRKIPFYKPPWFGHYIYIYIYQYCLYLYVDYILCTVPMHIIIYTYYNHNLQDPHVSSNSFELFFFWGGGFSGWPLSEKKHCRVEMLPGQAVSNGWIFCFWGGREILLSKQKQETPPLWSNKKCSEDSNPQVEPG